MPASDILIRGAREHNLRDIDLVLPRNRLICFTGVSGSGKSSLAFDTLYAEGQRRYVQSLSSFARQFLGQMPKPDVDLISGLNPAISISQKTGGQSPRSTVGTITEIYDYLRVLFARVGKGHCPKCGRPITAQTREQIIDRIMALPSGTRFLVLAPLIRGQKGEYRDLFADLLKQGFARARVDGRVVRLSDDLRLDRQMRHNIEVVIDRLVAGAKLRPRLAEAVELALRLGEGNLVVAMEEEERGERRGERGEGKQRRKTQNDEIPTHAAQMAASLSPLPSPLSPLVLSAHYACTHCNLSFEPPSPQLFSFNSPQGMCPECSGLGQIYTFDPERLIPEPSRSFQQGCIELVGGWREMGRWRRHIYRGVAEFLERTHGLPAGTVLETAWEELDPKLQNALLWGTGDEHVTFTWRSGPSGYKWGGKFEGIIPKLLSQYRTTKSRMQRRQLEKHMRILGCGGCQGARLNPQARAVTVTSRTSKFGDRPERSLPEVCALAVSDAEEFFGELELDPTGQKIAADVLKEIRGRLQFLKNVGLEYLTLERTAPTLSGGEMQRIRLAGQIGCGLVGVLYILDEPSIGLHPRDNDRLLGTLARLRDQGNTVIVVEHDEDTMRAADTHRRFWPRAGRSRRTRGGRRTGRKSHRRAQEHHRAISLRPAADRNSRPTPAARRRQAGGPRRHAQQPQRHRRGDSAGPVGVRDGRFGLGQELAGERHPGRGAQSRSERRPGQSGRPPADRRARASRQDDRHRPVADRANAALESGHVHQGVRRDSPPLHATARVEGPRLQAGPLQLQRPGRPLRGLRRERLEQAGDGLPGRRLGHLSGVRGTPLQPRDAANPLQGPVDRPSAGNGRAGSAATL